MYIFLHIIENARFLEVQCMGVWLIIMVFILILVQKRMYSERLDCNDKHCGPWIVYLKSNIAIVKYNKIFVISFQQFVSLWGADCGYTSWFKDPFIGTCLLCTSEIIGFVLPDNLFKLSRRLQLEWFMFSCPHGSPAPSIPSSTINPWVWMSEWCFPHYHTVEKWFSAINRSTYLPFYCVHICLCVIVDKTDIATVNWMQWVCLCVIHHILFWKIPFKFSGKGYCGNNNDNNKVLGDNA